MTIKRKEEDREHTTNCYICGIKLKYSEIKKNPNNENDTRIFCQKHYKKLFGKKRKLIKRY